MEELRTIVAYGIPMTTRFYEEVSEEEFNRAREEYFNRGTLKDRLKCLKSFIKGSGINKVTALYFKDLMAKVRFKDAKYTIEEVFNSRDLVNQSAGVFKNNTKVYPTTWTLCQNLVKRFGIGGKSFAKKPTQYPVESVESILSKYNVNDNYYDFSCGWGARLLGTLRSGAINYYGTDPNYLLVDRLYELLDDYCKIAPTFVDVDIRKSGSEDFVPEWENKMGLAFSSPPYFDLEDYAVGNQSYKKGTEYSQWLENYVRPTIKNIYRYLIDGGYFIFNIKNLKKYPLLTDWYKIAEEEGFKFVGTEDLNIVHRCTCVEGLCSPTNLDEQILVFQKVKTAP